MFQNREPEKPRMELLQCKECLELYGCNYYFDGSKTTKACKNNGKSCKFAGICDQPKYNLEIRDGECPTCKLKVIHILKKNDHLKHAFSF